MPHIFILPIIPSTLSLWKWTESLPKIYILWALHSLFFVLRTESKKKIIHIKSTKNLENHAIFHNHQSFYKPSEWRRMKYITLFFYNHCQKERKKEANEEWAWERINEERLIQKKREKIHESVEKIMKFQLLFHHHINRIHLNFDKYICLFFCG